MEIIWNTLVLRSSSIPMVQEKKYTLVDSGVLLVLAVRFVFSKLSQRCLLNSYGCRKYQRVLPGQSEARNGC